MLAAHRSTSRPCRSRPRPFSGQAPQPCSTAAWRPRRSTAQGAALVCAALPAEADAVVVGAGIAGLNAAAQLRAKGVDALLLEASDGVGGRVRTDSVDGFLLDRGFQIFLTGYPEAQATLDYQALNLKPFYAGALVRHEGQFHRVADPLRHPVDGVLSLPNAVGSVLDKVNVGVFRFKSVLGSLDDIFSAPELTTEARLKAEGFSDAIIDRFFRPFLGGIFFNRQLTTSSRLFAFVMRMLATGENCLPAAGIGAMSEQLAARLPKDSVVLGAKVQQVVGQGGGQPAKVVLADGQSVVARQGVVVAVEGPEAQRLLGSALEASPSKPEAGVGTCCLYFKAAKAPSPEPILYLNGTPNGIVNNCCFPSTVAPSYAPAGQALVSVSTIGTMDSLPEQQLVDTVKVELAQWFGAAEVSGWSHLRTYRIPFAQPNQTPPTNFKRPVSLGNGIFVCGDHRDSATFEGALVSGRRAAEALLAGAPSAAQQRVAAANLSA